MRWQRLLATVLFVLSGGLGPESLRAQEPFLSWDFEDGDLEDFHHNGMVADGCCFLGLLYGCAGGATADDGEMVLENSGRCEWVCPVTGLGAGGWSAVLARPEETVGPEFPLDYKLLVRVNLVSVNELHVALRAYGGIGPFLDPATGEDTGLVQVDAFLSRGYWLWLFPEGADWSQSFPRGGLAAREATTCDHSNEHPEWPDSSLAIHLGGKAAVDAGIEIHQGEWYWLEVSAHGEETGGPVVLTAKVWSEDDPPPELPQLVLEDADGLPHVLEAEQDDLITLRPENHFEFGLGTSLRMGATLVGLADFEPFDEARVDDLSLTELAGCREPPLSARRDLWETVLPGGDENDEPALYEDGTRHEVTITLSDLRPSGDCGSPEGADIFESVPEGWAVSEVSTGGTVEGSRIAWHVDLTAAPVEEQTLSYAVVPAGAGEVRFRGFLREPESEYFFFVDGQSLADSSEEFLRGDADANGAVNLTDAVFLLLHLFQSGGAPSCPDAADSNDDGALNLSDAVHVLNHLFLGGGPPPPPGESCAADSTEDELASCVYEPLDC